MDGQFPGSGNLGKKPEESRSQNLQVFLSLGGHFWSCLKAPGTDSGTCELGPGHSSVTPAGHL